MTIQTYKIELRVDFNNPELESIVQEAIVEKTRELVAVASLITDGAKPMVKCIRTPFFGAAVEIPIVMEE